MTLYRVTGEVTAPDGTSYEPIYWGDYYTTNAVLDAIVDGARDRGEAATVRLDRGPGTARITWARVGPIAYTATAPRLVAAATREEK